MGLLDKVDNLEETKPAKAIAKKAVAKKATPARAVAKKATPAKAVAKKVESKQVASKAERKPRVSRPTGLPEGFELAGNMPRYIGWLINFAWNFGIIIGLLSILSTGADSDLTLPWAGAGIMIICNWLVLPIWTGRNIGEFVSRSKYITASGSKPFAAHAILNNSLGFMSLAGVIMLFTSFQELSGSGLPPFIVGIVLILLWVVNFFFKKNSDYSQGIFDMAFSAYLVKHVATGTETGWMARFEGLGDFGDKWQQKAEKRQEKAKIKAEAAANSDEETPDEETPDAEIPDTKESED
jgi:hypothetical protein